MEWSHRLEDRLEDSMRLASLAADSYRTICSSSHTFECPHLPELIIRRCTTFSFIDVIIVYGGVCKTQVAAHCSTQPNEFLAILKPGVWWLTFSKCVRFVRTSEWHLIIVCKGNTEASVSKIFTTWLFNRTLVLQ